MVGSHGLVWVFSQSQLGSVLRGFKCINPMPFGDP